MSTDTTALTTADQDTATRALRQVRDNLKMAIDDLDESTAYLRDAVVDIRPKGLLTVDEMAEAVARDRNYIDALWSSHGATTKGKQTRVPVAEGTSPEAARWAYEALHYAADAQRRNRDRVNVARAERDRIVVMVYGSKLLGPSAISVEVGVDRNHVLRLSRKAGVKPVHRTDSRNQYSNGKS